ncbi:MAG: hypothetical protein NVSMB25_04580 [Thermoleophilaceae bacterium]
MKERKGPLGRTVGALTQGLAGAARRRQAQREPRVVVYDAAGRPDLVRSDLPAHVDIAETAERMLEIASAPPLRGRSRGDEQSTMRTPEQGSD